MSLASHAAIFMARFDEMRATVELPPGDSPGALFRRVAADTRGAAQEPGAAGFPLAGDRLACGRGVRDPFHGSWLRGRYLIRRPGGAMVWTSGSASANYLYVR
jgi:hypothetical protein